MVTAGDGGAIVAWGQPKNPGYVDSSGETDGVNSYTVTATSPTGQVVATRTTSDTSTVLSGLTNGTAYKIAVTAANPIGTGVAATATGTPTPVPGGTQQYADAVTQLLNAGDALEMGTASSASAAIAGDSQKSAISSWVNTVTPDYLAIKAYAAANQQQDTQDATTLSDVLAVPSSDGSSVTLYATANDTYITVDTSGNSPVSIPGSGADPVAYTFATGSSPSVTTTVDPSATTEPVTADTVNTASSSTLDPPPTTPTAVATESSGAFSPVPSGITSDAGRYSYLPGVVAWADRNAYGSYNGYGEDCTDFVSRALHYGGGLRERIPWFPIEETRNNNYWFQYRYWWGYRASSHSWGGARQLVDFEVRRGAHWVRYISWAEKGEVVFADWGHGLGISHAGIVARVTARNIYIDQHSYSHYHQALFKSGRPPYWISHNPNLKVYITPAKS